MYSVKYENGRVIDVTLDYKHGEGYQTRNDWKSFEAAEKVAADCTEATGDLFIALDAGSHTSPRYDIEKMHVVGEPVSYGMNGDCYPCGHITRISKTGKVITTDSGKRFFRYKRTGSWRYGKYWALVRGHHYKRNPSF